MGCREQDGFAPGKAGDAEVQEAPDARPENEEQNLACEFQCRCRRRFTHTGTVGTGSPNLSIQESIRVFSLVAVQVGLAKRNPTAESG